MMHIMYEVWTYKSNNDTGSQMPCLVEIQENEFLQMQNVTYCAAQTTGMYIF